MKIGVIGAGSIGRRHIANALSLGCSVSAYDVDLTAFHDVPRSVECCTQWPEDVDAYIVCSPADHHAAQAVNCWRRNTPTLIEKPLALSVSDWAQHAPSALGPLATVGYSWRFYPLVRELRHRIFATVGTRYCEASFWYAGDRSTWPGKSYADTLTECSHEIDLAQHLLGPATCIDAKHDGSRWTLILAHERARSTIVLDDGAQIRSRGVHLLFEDGTQDGYRVSSADRGGLDASYQQELAHFLKCVKEGSLKPPACSLAEGLAVLTMCDDARRLAEKAA